MDLVRAIGDCKSKQEEDSIVGREVVNLRVRLADASAQGRMRELMIRMMYCEMLGHRVEFGYIHAVNLTQRPTLTEKRTGYLAASLFLDSASELLILLVITCSGNSRARTTGWCARRCRRRGGPPPMRAKGESRATRRCTSSSTRT